MNLEQKKKLSKTVVEKWNDIDQKEDKSLVIQPDLSDIIYIEQLIEILAEKHEYSYARFPSNNDFKFVYNAIQEITVPVKSPL